MKEAVRKVSGLLSTVKTAKSQFSQRTETDKESIYRLTFGVLETDSKGKINDELYYLNLADLDPASIAYKVDRDVVVVNADVRQKRKFIRYSTGGVVKNFTERLKLYAESADAARTLVDALRSAAILADKNYQAGRLPDTYEGLTLWLKSNVGPATVGTDRYEQELSFDTRNPLQVTFRQSRTDAKGSSKQADVFVVNAGDLSVGDLKIDVRSNQLELTIVTKNRQKFIRYTKAGRTDGNVSSFELVSADVDRIRDTEAAWRKLIPLAEKKLVAERPALTTVAEARKYISTAVGPVRDGDQTIEQAIRPDCLCTLSRKESGARSATEELYTVELADLTDKDLKFDVNKALYVLDLPVQNKQRYVSYHKNGVRQNYTSEVRLLGADLDGTRYLPAAFSKLIQSCMQSRQNAPAASGLTGLTARIPSLRNEDEELKQTLVATGPGTCQLRFTTTQTGKKTVETSYDLKLKDLNADLTDFVVSGKNVFVNLFTNGKEKIINTQQDGRPANYVNTVRFQIDDVGKARAVADVARQLIRACSTN
ncbi:hypothetical protein GCM10027423_34280 [Spirosoma arcticum]